MITVIVPTKGRTTLAATLDSLAQLSAGDSVIVGVDGDQPQAQAILGSVSLPCPLTTFVVRPQADDLGCTPRNLALSMVDSKSWVCWLDDDDIWVDGAAKTIRAKLREPHLYHMFRMQWPDGRTFWRERKYKWANVGSPMFVSHISHARLGKWDGRRGSDYRYIGDVVDDLDKIQWHKDVICHVRPHERDSQEA